MESYYANLLFEIIINESKEVKNATLKALYEMAKDGDFDRLDSEVINKVLFQLQEEEDMPDCIGEIYDRLTKLIRKHRPKHR